MASSPHILSPRELREAVLHYNDLAAFHARQLEEITDHHYRWDDIRLIAYYEMERATALSALLRLEGKG